MSSAMIPGKERWKLDMTEERLDSEALYVSMNICEVGQGQEQAEIN